MLQETYFSLFKKRSKKNELEIFEEFRIAPKKEERKRIEAITKGYKDGKIKGTAWERNVYIY